MSLSILSMLRGQQQRQTSASLAKERLQLILTRERIGSSDTQPDFLPQLQRELMEVVSRYVTIDPRDVKVQFERQDNLEVLEVKIELPDSQHR